jgi:hypothetical protein
MVCDREQDEEVLKYNDPVSSGHSSTDVGVTCTLVVFVTLVSICLLQIGYPPQHSLSVTTVQRNVPFKTFSYYTPAPAQERVM